MTLLEVRGLKTHFFTRQGVVKAVDGVSFDLDRGETLGIVGESGSGKSAMSLSLLRLISPPGEIVEGEVRFDGVDLLQLDEAQMQTYRGRHMSMILQDPLSSLNPVLTIADQVGEGIILHDRIRGEKLQRRLIELMQLVGIPAPETRLGQYPHQLSGGMRQRVVGAISIACRPEFLIADEPTTALDLTIQLQYLNTLKDIQRSENLALLLITHDLGVVAKMCDRVAVMYAGKIVETGTVEDIFDRPKHPYTVALLNSAGSLDKVERLNSIEGQPPSLADLPPNCAFYERCPVRFERCLTPEVPPLFELAGGQQARCWKHE
ncbi:MAG TPA: ABC transporter ATP-binding protein [Devosia sp.]|nr:ABC transporter ATP-binding protein [Devosia sp.]